MVPSERQMAAEFKTIYVNNYEEMAQPLRLGSQPKNIFTNSKFPYLPSKGTPFILLSLGSFFFYKRKTN